MTAAFSLVPETTLVERIAPALVKSPVLQEALAYWTRLRGERPYPAREELNPRDMAAMLPHISLLKVIDNGADFEHRIVGDVMVRAFNVPIQNRRFSEIAWDAPEIIDASFPLFREVVNGRAPIAWRQRTGQDALHAVFHQSELLLLPLGHDGVDHVLGFGVHESRLSHGGMSLA